MQMRWTRRSGAGIGAAALLALAFPGSAAADVPNPGAATLIAVQFPGSLAVDEPSCGGAELDPQALVVSLTTALGEVCIELFEDAAPGHVENFLWYLDQGGIDGSFFHRSVPGFILQGGGFRAANGEHQRIAAREGVVVVNEPCELDLFTNDLPSVPICSTRGNERGTLAMAKLGGDPDSGTTNWFINLADNRANLDNQNGGFTVFGQVLEEDMTVVDALAALDAAPLTQLFWHSSQDSAFTGSSGESTLPLLTTPALDVGDFGCFEAETLALAVNPAPSYLTLIGDPFDATDFFRMSGACGDTVAPEAFEVTDAGESCSYGSVLALAAEVRASGIYPAVDSEENLIYFGFSCEAAEEAIAQRSAWKSDFDARFDAQLVTVESAVRVPEPCCGPAGTLAALTVLSALRRRRAARELRLRA